MSMRERSVKEEKRMRGLGSNGRAKRKRGGGKGRKRKGLQHTQNF